MCALGLSELSFGSENEHEALPIDCFTLSWMSFGEESRTVCLFYENDVTCNPFGLLPKEEIPY